MPKQSFGFSIFDFLIAVITKIWITSESGINKAREDSNFLTYCVKNERNFILFSTFSSQFFDEIMSALESSLIISLTIDSSSNLVQRSDKQLQISHYQQ